MTTIAGAVTVVTGGASGIGEAICREFARRGAHMIVADLDGEAARAVSAEVDGLAVTADVASADDIRRIAAATVERHGRVDILVNNAGVGPQAPISAMTEEDWRWLLDVNLWSVIHGIRIFLPLLERDSRPAHIVNVASMSALDPMSPLGGYAVSKAGVLALTEVLAQELRGAGSPVHATAVLPGPTRTAIAESLRHRPSGASGALQRIEIDPPAALWRDPGDVATIIAEAVEHDEDYVAPHPELWGRVEARTAQRKRAFGSFP